MTSLYSNPAVQQYFKFLKQQKDIAISMEGMTGSQKTQAVSEISRIESQKQGVEANMDENTRKLLSTIGGFKPSVEKILVETSNYKKNQLEYIRLLSQYISDYKKHNFKYALSEKKM
jgi:type II secretory pathway predicted ATPase ExeA